jgi:hypothetical protein
VSANPVRKTLPAVKTPPASTRNNETAQSNVLLSGCVYSSRFCSTVLSAIVAEDMIIDTNCLRR